MIRVLCTRRLSAKGQRPRADGRWNGLQKYEPRASLSGTVAGRASSYPQVRIDIIIPAVLKVKTQREIKRHRGRASVVIPPTSYETLQTTIEIH